MGLLILPPAKALPEEPPERRDKIMEGKMPVEVRNAQQDIMQILRQFRLDQELETMDFIEIRNRFFEAFELLTICLDKKVFLVERQKK